MPFIYLLEAAAEGAEHLVTNLQRLSPEPLDAFCPSIDTSGTVHEGRDQARASAFCQAAYLSTYSSTYGKGFYY